MEAKYRIVVVGCGFISHEWFRYLKTRTDSKVVGLVDMKPENAEKMNLEYGLGAPVFTNLTEALEETSPNLVFDITYVMNHVNIVTEALENRCNVFSEKPMALTPEQAVKMVETAKRTGLKYSILQNRRYNKAMRAMRDTIKAGTIGKPGFVCADIFTSGDLRSIRNKLDKPMMMDNAVHTFDQARFLLGEDASTVYAESLNPEGSIYTGDAAGVCVFRMGENCVFDYRCWLGVEGCHTSWESEWRIIGSKGTMRWDGINAPYYEIPDYDYIGNKGNPFAERNYVRIVPETEWNGLESHAGAIQEMFDALEEGRDAETDCKDNLKSMMMVFGALESAEVGKKLSMGEFMERYMK